MGFQEVITRAKNVFEQIFLKDIVECVIRKLCIFEGNASHVQFKLLMGEIGSKP